MRFYERRLSPATGIAILLVLAIGGLFYVKWLPYYHNWQAMVLGLALGAALQEFAPLAWIARTLGRSSWGGVATGGLLAIPGMMCTCCAAPVVIGLRRRHASAALKDRNDLGIYTEALNQGLVDLVLAETTSCGAGRRLISSRLSRITAKLTIRHARRERLQTGQC